MNYFDSDMYNSTLRYYDGKDDNLYVAHNLFCQIRADDNSSTGAFTHRIFINF